jgi:flagellar basal-body rod protein FlgG
MQALWNAASGIASQQRIIDVISNNVANVNTVGYKAQDVSFQDLLYRQFDQKNLGAIDGQDPATLKPRSGPLDLALGSGVRLTNLESDFTVGSYQNTGQPLDLAIDGKSFFGILTSGTAKGGMPSAYTRNGHFQVSADASGKSYLVTDQGFKVADSNGQPIDVTGYDPQSIQIASDGTLTAVHGGKRETVAQVGLFYVDHPESSLKPAGDNLFAYVPSPGSTSAPIISQLYAVTPQDKLNVGQVRSGFLEQSNVDLTTQMTDLMQAQRALDLNAKAVQTADQMMGIANNLRS